MIATQPLFFDKKLFHMKEPLIGKTLDELRMVAQKGKMPAFVGKQLADWLYAKGVTDFEEMINISKRNRAWLEENYSVGREMPSDFVRSSDGTIKYLFKTPTSSPVEAVYIPDRDRATLCVSSQIGCKMNCYFCATGKLGFKGQLTSAQIMNQILSTPPDNQMKEWGLNPLSNIVFMGMGEPLDNWTEVKKAIEIITAPWGMAWSPRRITVSTVGKLPELKDLIEHTDVNIALSLHTPDMEERLSMMPAQKAFPIREVLKVIKGYDFSGQRRFSVEYIMWKGVNDDMDHARALVKLLQGIDCRVNLIRFHEIPGVKLKPASEERMLMFRNFLNSKGITATIRASRGEDVMAACGMLAGKK